MQGSELGTPHFGSPRTDHMRPSSSTGRVAPGIEDECGMVMELNDKSVSKIDLEGGNAFHY